MGAGVNSIVEYRGGGTADISSDAVSNIKFEARELSRLHMAVGGAEMVDSNEDAKDDWEEFTAWKAAAKVNEDILSVKRDVWVVE